MRSRALTQLRAWAILWVIALHLRVMDYIGETSYALYLTHLQIIVLAERLGQPLLLLLIPFGSLLEARRYLRFRHELAAQS